MSLSILEVLAPPLGRLSRLPDLRYVATIDLAVICLCQSCLQVQDNLGHFYQKLLLDDHDLRLTLACSTHELPY